MQKRNNIQVPIICRTENLAQESQILTFLFLAELKRIAGTKSLQYSQCMTQYDLEERTFLFAKAVRNFLKDVPSSVCNNEYAKQLIRASASISANYLEANDALGRKDFFMHIRISRKEAKESYFWLRLIDLSEKEKLEPQRQQLVQEVKELRLILSSIIQKLSQRQI